MSTTLKNKFLALADDGLVEAVFTDMVRAQTYCYDYALCMMEFNASNRQGLPTPQAGDTYRA